MNKLDDYSTIDTRRKHAGPKTLDFSLEETNCTLTHHRHSPKNSTISHDDEVVIGSRFNFQNTLNIDDKSSYETERMRQVHKSHRNQKESQFNDSFQTFPSHDEKCLPQDISISEIGHQPYDRSFYSDRMSIQRPFNDFESVRVSMRSNIDPSEYKANLFFRTKLYYKYLLLLKNNANNRRNAAYSLLCFISDSARRQKQESLTIWREFTILSGTIPSNRSQELRKRKSRQNKSPKVPNLDLDISHSSVSLNPLHIYRYFCAKRMMKGFKEMMIAKENKEKAGQFLYYNLLFKHMYRWIEYSKQKKSSIESIPTRRSDVDTRSIPTGRYSNAMTTNRDPLKVSYITDSELSYTLSRSYINEFVEESTAKYRMLVLKKKAFYLLRSYQILQAKKNNLNEMLAKVLKKNYMTIPFKFWQSKFKKVQKQRLAAKRLFRGVFKIVQAEVFTKIKDARRILVTRRKHIQAGIIKKQQIVSELLTAKPNPNISRNDISMIVDKENINNNIDVSAEIGYKKLKNQLSSIFPSKRDKENKRPTFGTESSFSSIGTNSSIIQKQKTFVSSMITDKENLNKILDSPNSSSTGNQDSELSPRASYKIPRNSLQNKSVSFLKGDEVQKSIANVDKLNISSISPIHASKKCNAQTSPIKHEEIIKLTKKEEIKKPAVPPKVTRNTKNKLPPGPSLNKTTIEAERDDSKDASMLNMNNESLNLSRISAKQSLNNSYVQSKYVPTGRRRTKSTQTNVQVQIKSVPVPGLVPQTKAKESKEPSIASSQREKYQVMIKDLEEHLNFLNKKLLDQKLMNKMLQSVKTELIEDSQLL